MTTNDTNTIKNWMRQNKKRFIDECGEVNCTAMVEAWDFETQDGEQTLDGDHIAWDIAVIVADES